MRERLAAEAAMDNLIAEGIASGKITQDQAQLLGGRGLGGPMMARRGSAGEGRVGAPCRGMGIGSGW